MERFIDIAETPFGKLYGRDCIFLDSAALKKNDLILEGEINGTLFKKTSREKWTPFRLTFKDVIAHFACELDTYENISRIGGCFGIIEESEQLKKLPVRNDFDKSEYKHYRVCTYDFVFDVFAKGFEFSADLKKASGF